MLSSNVLEFWLNCPLPQILRLADQILPLTQSILKILELMDVSGTSATELVEADDLIPRLSLPSS
jgi:hypothetical protein